MERKLASIRRIAEVKPIDKADAIEAVRVDGWWVVAKKGEFKVDDPVVYFEIDSWIPTEIAPFLTKPGHYPKEYEGVKGERLRTVKLRGQVSQGLVLPLNILSGEWCDCCEDCPYSEGDDVTDTLKIKKYEPPVPAQLAGTVKGLFPSFIRKTDQERCMSGDTLVLTRLNGEVPIKDLVELQSMEEVLSMNEIGDLEWRNITGHSSLRNNNDWIRLHLEDGTYLDVTPGHRVFLPELGCYRLASDLLEGDILLKNELPSSVLEDNNGMPNLLTSD